MKIKILRTLLKVHFIIPDLIIAAGVKDNKACSKIINEEGEPRGDSDNNDRAQVITHDTNLHTQLVAQNLY